MTVVGAPVRFAVTRALKYAFQLIGPISAYRGKVEYLLRVPSSLRSSVKILPRLVAALAECIDRRHQAVRAKVSRAIPAAIARFAVTSYPIRRVRLLVAVGRESQAGSVPFSPTILPFLRDRFV